MMINTVVIIISALAIGSNGQFSPQRAYQQSMGTNSVNFVSAENFNTPGSGVPSGTRLIWRQPTDPSHGGSSSSLPAQMPEAATSTSMVITSIPITINQIGSGTRRKQAKVSDCEFWLNPNGGNITSFGRRTSAGQLIHCVYRIPAVEGNICSLTLHFRDIDLRPEVSSKPTARNQAIEKEFSQLVASSETCTTDYLEFNGRKRYCENDWKDRVDTVELLSEEKEFAFKFVSDKEDCSNGFNIEYRPILNSCNGRSDSKNEKLKHSDSSPFPVQMLASQSVASECEERHSEMEFELKSANFPGNYSNNLDCVYYVVRASDQVCGLELRFLQFALEESEGCAYDFLEVDGENFCGRLPNGSRNVFGFRKEIKTISFQTDGQYTGAGFHIKVRQLTDCENTFMPAENEMLGGNSRTQRCNFVVRDLQGQLVSIHYPEPYPEDLLCAYTIEKKSNNCLVELSFDHFDLQDSKDCEADFFELDGGRFCGKMLHKTKRVIPFNRDEFVKFLFKTDNNKSSQGFAVNYKQLPCGNQQHPGQVVSGGGDEDDPNAQFTSVPQVADSSRSEHQHNRTQHFYQKSCDAQFDRKKFTLASEMNNGSYKENLDCVYTVTKSSEKVCYLEMHFVMFDLEASTDCQYDFVEIGNAVRLCGTLNQETSRIYVFDKPEMTITFHTDASTERRGFRIETEQLECEGDRIIRDDQGDDSPPAAAPEEPRDNLQSLEQNKFEQQQIHKEPNQIVIQQPDNLLHSTSSIQIYPSKSTKFGAPDVYCSKIFREQEFFIYSPGYPSRYPTDQDCLYMIQAFSPHVCKIEIHFQDFELQPFDFQKNCRKSDFLDVNDREVLCGKVAESTSRVYPFTNQTFFMHFHSDSFRTSFDRGFRLYVRQRECFGGGTNEFSTSLPTKSITPCSKVLASSVFEIKSPLYPTLYPPNSYCQYRVIRQPEACYLEMQFVDFDMQDSHNCDKDHLNVNGVKVCGSLPKDSVRLFPFFGDEFIITFSSDRAISGRGFHLRATQNPCPTAAPLLPPQQRIDDQPSKPPSTINRLANLPLLHQINQQCQQHFTSMIFEFESPNYPHYYLPSLSCGYTIHKHHATVCKLELYFIDFDLEPSIHCVKDYLLIDGVKYCNTNRPNSVLQVPFFEQQKQIHFRTSSFGTSKGYLAQARQVDCGIDPTRHVAPTLKSSFLNIKGTSGFADKLIFLPSLPSICEICVTQVNGNLQSYDYPNFYPPNLNCTYRITPLPDNCMVQIRFDEFDFDYSAECNQDYLEINGVRYCGNQLKGVSMILLNKRKEDLSIRMVTSGRGAIVKPSFRGFRASYTQMPCLETAPEVASTPTPKVPDYSNQTLPVRIIQAKPIYCDQTFDDKSFDIKSPGFPYQYFDNLNCAYLIRKNNANVCRLRLTFNYFNVVGEDGHCKGDYLDVVNARICGVLERYTKKEIPFLGEKLLLNFHTNSLQTANGFHLVVDQVDCISPEAILVKSSTSLPPPVPKTMGSSGVKSPHRLPVPFVQQKNSLKYDDDDIVPDTDTKKSTLLPSVDSMSTTRPYVAPTKTNQPPRVEYVSAQPDSGEDSTADQLPPNVARADDHPHRYYSHNITVHNEEDPGRPDSSGGSSSGSSDSAGIAGSSSSEKPGSSESPSRPSSAGSFQPDSTPVQQKQDYKPYPDSPHHREHEPSKLCRESMVQKMFFELKASDLIQLNDNTGTCQVHVMKAKSNICQLDVMFIRYSLNDSTCGQQYLSVDGERICGHVHESTVKKFWFVRSELYLFVKLNQFPMGEIGDDLFQIKARQVECVTNVDSHPSRQPSNEIAASDQHGKLVPDQPRYKNPSQPTRGPELRGPKGQRYNNNRYGPKPFDKGVPNVGDSGGYGYKAGTKGIHRGSSSNYYPGDPSTSQYPASNQYPLSPASNQYPPEPSQYPQIPTTNQFPRDPSFNQYPQSTNRYPQGPTPGQFPASNQFPRDPSANKYPKSPASNQYPQAPATNQYPQSPNQYPQAPSSASQYPHGPNEDSSQSEPFNRYCDLIDSDLQFNITSPRDRGLRRCRYTIRKANNKVCAIDIRFNSFHLHDDHRCEHEFMEIDSGKICGAFPLGHERRYHFLPEEYEKVIYYTSSKSLRTPGDFALDIRQIEDCSKPLNQKPSLSMPTICDRSSRSLRGNFQSPNYPGPYDDFTQCTYRIQAYSRDYCKVKFVVRDIDIETDSKHRCIKDSLEVQHNRLCGKQVDNREFTVPFEQINAEQMVQLKFISDATGTGRGFNLDYYQELCDKRSSHSYVSPGMKGLSKIANQARFGPFGNQKASGSSNVIHEQNPIRPNYPPNYVSKAHVLKSMDRKEFIKMMLMEDEKDRLKMNITQVDNVEPTTTTMATFDDQVTITMAPDLEMTTVGDQEVTTAESVTTTTTESPTVVTIGETTTVAP